MRAARFVYCLWRRHLRLNNPWWWHRQVQVSLALDLPQLSFHRSHILLSLGRASRSIGTHEPTRVIHLKVLTRELLRKWILRQWSVHWKAGVFLMKCGHFHSKAPRRSLAHIHTRFFFALLTCLPSVASNSFSTACLIEFLLDCLTWDRLWWLILYR